MALASVSTARYARFALIVAAPAYATMASHGADAKFAGALKSASMASYGANAWPGVVPASACTASSAPDVQNAKTSHVPLKAAHYSATVSAQPKCF